MPKKNNLRPNVFLWIRLVKVGFFFFIPTRLTADAWLQHPILSSPTTRIHRRPNTSNGNIIIRYPSPSQEQIILYAAVGEDSSEEEKPLSSSSSSSSSSPLEDELQRLQERYALIEALEERNQAQLDSFIDEKDQWQSLEEDERTLLSSKPHIEQRMAELSETLIQLWIGQKSMNG